MSVYSEEVPSEAQAIDLARECLYRFLAAALSDPGGERWRLLLDFENQDLARDAADLLRDEAPAVPLGCGELPSEALDVRALLLETIRPIEDLRAEYDRVFGLVPARECPPYETEYHPSSETFFRSQQLADIAGFYRAFALDPSRAEPERPDHVALELEFMAFLLLKKRLALASGAPEEDIAERVSLCDEVERTFFRDHLAWWVPSFTTGLRRKAGSGFYAVAGRVLAALLPVERARFGLEAPRLSLPASLIERPEEQAGCAGCAVQP
jgi:TorA maturation chaperone TorD